MSTAAPGAGARTETARDEYRLLRGENRLRAERIRAHRLAEAETRSRRRRELSESLAVDWVTPYAELLDIARNTGDPVTAGPTSYWQRRGGRNWPVYQTEAELNLLRAPARLLLAANGYAQGLVEGLTSYVVGSGCTYRLGKVSDSDDTPKEVIDAAQRVVDAILERAQWFGGEQPGLEEELFGRSIEDGEWILAHYPQDDGTCEFRVQEPEQLTQPPGSGPEYAFGIETPAGDAAKHVRYYLQYGDTPEEGEEHGADEVTHFRRNVRRNMKRGVTDFCFDTYDALSLASRLRTNLGDTAAQQAAIVAVRQWETGSEEELQAFVDADADFTRADQLTGERERIKVRRRGSWEDVPKGMSYQPGPIASSTPIHIQVLDACLRGAGQKWQAPPWLMSGDLNAMNYATSLTAESPFVKTVQRRQRGYTEAFRRPVWFALAHWVRTHGLVVRLSDGRVLRLAWEDVEKRLKLTVTAPNPETRNKLEEAQRAATEIPLGVQSRQQYMQEQGRDPDKIEADNQEYADKFGDQGQPLPTDAPPDDPGGGGGAGARTGDGDGFALPESLLESDDGDDGTFAVALLEADAPPGKVWKEITYNRGGKQVTQKRLVNAPKAAAAKPAAKGKPDPKAKPKKADPAETVRRVGAQLMGDPAKLTPAKIKALDADLATLTVPQLKALKKQHDLKGGKTKADHVAALVAKAKELKRGADAQKRAAKKAAPPAAKPEPAPAPKVEPPKESPKPVETHPVAKQLVTALNAAPGLSDGQREHYGRAIARVVRAMPKAALDRANRHTQAAQFYAAPHALASGIIDTLATKPGLTAKESAALREKYAWLAAEPAGGCYVSYADGSGPATLLLDGDQDFGGADQGRYGRTDARNVQAAHSIYAHELAHAIDGPNGGARLSGTADWRDAYATEIEYTDDDRAARREPPLTAYGGSKVSEGWAEFGRLVYGSDVPHAQIARDFPKATAVWKRHGLWPDAERTGPEARMPEVFSKGVDLGTDGSHADVLLKPGGAKPAPKADAKPAPKLKPEDAAASLKSIGEEAVRDRHVDYRQFKARALEALRGMSHGELNRVWKGLGRKANLRSGPNAAEEVARAALASRITLDRADI